MKNIPYDTARLCTISRAEAKRAEGRETNMSPSIVSATIGSELRGVADHSVGGLIKIAGGVDG